MMTVATKKGGRNSREKGTSNYPGSVQYTGVHKIQIPDQTGQFDKPYGKCQLKPTSYHGIHFINRIRMGNPD